MERLKIWNIKKFQHLLWYITINNFIELRASIVRIMFIREYYLRESRSLKIRCGG